MAEAREAAETVGGRAAAGRVAAAAEAARLLGRTLALIWTTDTGATALLLLAAVGHGLVPVGRLWVAKLIVDGLIAALADGGADPEALGALLPLVGLEFGLAAAGAALTAAAQGTQVALAHRLRTRIGEAVLRVATRLDYAVLEDPALHDRLQRAQTEAAFRPVNLLLQLSYALTGLVGLAGTLALLVRVHVLAPLVLVVLAPLVLVVLALPHLYVQARSGHAAFYTLLFQSADARRLSYLGALTGGLDAAKEVRLFGLAGYLLAAYRAVAQRLLRQTLRIVRVQSVGSALAGVLAAAGSAGAAVYLLVEVLARRLTVGDLTIYTGAFVQGGLQAQAVAGSLGGVTENGLFLRDLFEFLDLDRAAEAASAPPGAGPEAGATPTTPGDGTTGRAAGIVFEGVRFRYPGRDAETLRGVSLAVPPGAVVALVGCTAGYGGAGPHDTLFVQRLCGFLEGALGARGTTALERTFLGVRTFFLRRGAGAPGWL